MKDAQEVYDRYNIENILDDFKPRFNIRPGQMNPVVTGHGPNKISRMFWGLIPHFAQDRNYKYKTINAKAETVAKLPTFREPLRTKRCIVPATGFFEPDKKHFSTPPFPWHYFQLKDQKIFGFAGLYDIWQDRNTNNPLISYTIITTIPNSLVGKIHHRMPVILKKEDEEAWLNPDIMEPEHVLPLLKSYPAEDMKEWEVSGEARSPRNDNPTVIKPVQ